MEKKTITIGIAIILGIVLLSLASAESIYSGECLPVDLSEMQSLENIVYDIVGNSSNMDGLTISLNGTIANICISPNFKPDSFTIIFIDNSTKEVIKEVNVGGGGTSYKTEYVDRYKIIYKDKIVKDDEEIIKLNDDIKRIEEDLEKKKRELLLFITLSLISLVALFFLLKKIIKNRKKFKKYY